VRLHASCNKESLYSLILCFLFEIQAYLFRISITYLLTPWSRVLPEKLKRPELLKKFPAFYGARRFITAFTRARHLSLYSARLIQSIPPHLASRISILILSSHLRLGLPSGLRPSGFPSKPFMHLSSRPYVPCVLPISVFFTWSLEWYLVRSTEHKALNVLRLPRADKTHWKSTR
jgi:hypothetical protein